MASTMVKMPSMWRLSEVLIEVVGWMGEVQEFVEMVKDFYKDRLIHVDESAQKLKGLVKARIMVV